MATDIHICVEKKVENKWVLVNKYVENENYGKYENAAEYIREPIYSTRNYVLFAVLADVRNPLEKNGAGYHKFISSPKGIPYDVSLETKAIIDEDGIIGHSHSWLSLGELLVYDWRAFIGSSSGANTFASKLFALFKSKRKRYKDICDEFYNETLPTLVSYGKPNNVRIVFWFDG